MPVFRVERNKGYTVMSNYHLRDKSLSLKAKGLLSQILSLPEDWDYTLSGLCYINRESKDAIRSAVNELERAGYIERHQTTDEGGKFSSNEYIIHEQPVSLPPSLDKPSSENPTTGKPTSENPTQLNKDRVTKDQAITDRSITHSIPSLSPPPAGAAVAASPPERESCNEGMAVFSAPSATAGIKTTHSREKMGKSACQLTEKRPRSRSAPADTASACSVVRGDMGRSLAAGSVRFSALLRLESVFPRRAGACQKRGEEHPGISGRSRLF